MQLLKVNQQIKANNHSQNISELDNSASQNKILAQKEPSQVESSFGIKADSTVYHSEENQSNRSNQYILTELSYAKEPSQQSLAKQQSIDCKHDFQHFNMQSQFHSMSGSISFTKEICCLNRLNWEQMPETIELKQKYKTIQNRMKTLQTENKDLLQKLEELTAENEKSSLMGEAIQLKQKYKSLQADKKTLETENKALLQKLEELTAEKEKSSLMSLSSNAIDSQQETKPKTTEQKKSKEKDYRKQYYKLLTKYKNLRNISEKIIIGRGIIPENANK